MHAAGVPDSAAFATKPVLAQQMITAALAAHTPAAWVSADEVHGQNPHLRTSLEEHRIGYVMAVPRTWVS